MKEWSPAAGPLMTEWAEKIDPENVLPRYPRPQLCRDEWFNLNGLWDYAITEKDASGPAAFEGKILVPFAIETPLSGVMRALSPDERLWYRRVFKLPPEWRGRRVLLNFEAVDWECTCFINGRAAGEHRGGYLPFSFDITGLLQPGENDILVAVYDPTDTLWQQRGKQVLEPEKIYYTATSGIWQTVWLEPVPEDNHIIDYRVTPSLERGGFIINAATEKPAEVEISIMGGSKKIASCRGRSGEEHFLQIENPRPWSPEDPFLYDLEIMLASEERGADRVTGYCALRSFSTARDGAGHMRFCLNSEPLFLHGPLDQGYWPDGGLTPPCEEAIIFDIEKTKQFGFNMTRKHIKVAPRRWYYHADRGGLIVIQDMISGGSNMAGDLRTVLAVLGKRRAPDTTPKAHRRAWREALEARTDFERELYEMMDHLYNVPSIGVWVVFNESWGQYDSTRIGDEVKRKDPSRLVDYVSGWFDQGAGDFQSLHTYVIGLKKPRRDERIYMISEYGGYNFNCEGHIWSGKDIFAYKKEKNIAELEKSYTKLMRSQLIPLIKKGLSAAVYTQFSDVEIETNGFYTYDRKILKIKEETIRSLNEEIYAEFRERVK